MSILQDAPQRGDSVMADLGPIEGVVPGEVVATGERYTIAVYDGTTYIEVDEANVWRNGNGYSIEEI